MQTGSKEFIRVFVGLAAIVTIIAGYAAAIVKDQGRDEWNRSADRFSNQWGGLAGASLIVFLLAIPPVHNFIYLVASSFTAENALDTELALFIFVFGFITLLLSQLVCTLVLGRIWRWHMSKPEE